MARARAADPHSDANLNAGRGIQLVFAGQFSTLATHAVEVRPAGNGRVNVDAFAVLR